MTTDFTVAAYGHYLKSITKRSDSITFSQIDDDFELGNKLLWRHDVDHSLNRALDIARIDREHGMSSTFFIRVRGDFYSIFERSQSKLLAKIGEFGHEFGLHFEMGHDQPSEGEFTNQLSYDAALLENEVGFKIRSFSFHQPTPGQLSFKNLRYADLINAYSDFIYKNFGYVSDSNGYWRFESLENVLKSNVDNLQVLTHPEWWQKEAMTPYQRIERCIYGRADSALQLYNSQLAEGGRSNLGCDFKVTKRC